MCLMQNVGIPKLVPMPTPPLAHPPLLQTLPLQIAEQIARSIVNGSFSPGSRLREVELAEYFNVSRATIREALRHLEQRSLVRIQPQRGAHVTQLSAKELDDLFEVRASLLATGSRLAAERCTPGDAQALKLHLEKLKQSVEDLDAYSTASARLVEVLVRLSGNDVLVAYVNDFALRIGRYVRLGLATDERRKRSLGIWVKVIDAVIRGDGDTAATQHRALALGNRSAALEEFHRQHEAAAASPAS